MKEGDLPKWPSSARLKALGDDNYDKDFDNERIFTNKKNSVGVKNILQNQFVYLYLSIDIV